VPPGTRCNRRTGNRGVVEIAYLPHRTPGRGRALMAGAVRSVLPRHLAENTLLVVATPQ
jgi:hypothetical protein